MSKTDQQLPLSEIEAQPRPSPEPKVAFGRFVKPEMYDMFGEYDFAEINDQEKAWLTPRRIHENLFNRRYDDPCVVDRLALNGYEYKIIARSPEHLAETAFSTTLAADDVTEDRLAAAERSGLHVLESKQEAMIEHVQKLNLSKADIQKLSNLARQPGYAHVNQETMKLLINNAWTEFKTMLEVVHIQRKWTDDQRHKAETSLIHYLTQGAQTQRVKHWKTMLSLANAYLSSRISVFQNRVDSIGQILDTSDSWEPTDN